MSSAGEIYPDQEQSSAEPLMRSLGSAVARLSEASPSSELSEEEAILQQIISRNEAQKLQDSYYYLDALPQYLNKIGKYKLLSASEEVALSKLVRSGLAAAESLESLRESNWKNLDQEQKLLREISVGQQARREFINANLRLVVYTAKKMMRRIPNGSVELIDIIQMGNLGLEHAVDKFDGRKGFKFSTYASWWIKQYIARELDFTATTIRIPSNPLEAIRSIKNLEKEGFDDEKIIEMTGITSDKLSELRRVDIMRSNTSLDETVGSDTETTYVERVVDPSSSAAFEPGYTGGDDLVEGLLKILSENEAAVLVRRFGILDGTYHSLENVGKELGVTREWIRKIQIISMIKLRHPSAYKKLLNIFPIDQFDQEWKLEANCLEADTKIMTKPKRAKDTARDVEERVAICQSCPVKSQCEEERHNAGATFGVWAGRMVTAKLVKEKRS